MPTLLVRGGRVVDPSQGIDRIDDLLELDRRRRELLPGIEGARSERKAASERIGEDLD